MQLAFIDESSDSKFKEYFGLCCAAINSHFYGPGKKEFQGILHQGGWDTSIEFKGHMLVSATQGDTSVSLDHRIQMASRIIALTAAKVNGRMTVRHASIKAGNHKQAYLRLL